LRVFYASFSSNIGEDNDSAREDDDRTEDDDNHVSEYVLIFISGVRVPL